MDLSEVEARIRQILQEKTDSSCKKLWKEVVTALHTSPFDYRYEHTLAVVRNARAIAKRVGADVELVVLAAWLHDIAKPTTMSDKEHAEKSGRIAAEILGELGLPREKIEKVETIIKKHPGLVSHEKIEPIEAACLWDADKLAKLGVTHLFHHLPTLTITDPCSSTIGQLEKLGDYIRLAERIVGSMKTEPGKKAAKERLKALRWIYRQLKREILVEDIV